MKKNNTLLLILLLMGTLTQISADIYTPSLAAIAHAFHATLGQVQLTMTWFIFGVAITGLIYGPLSEGIGRRSTIMIGLVIALIGTVFCLVAKNIIWLQMGRLIQGLGLGATSALWRSIFRDAYSGEEMARVASFLTNMIVVSVILAPFLGGYIQQYAGWHFVFIVLFMWIAFVLLTVVFLFKETGTHHGKHRLNAMFMFQAYRELLTSRLFMGMSISVLLTYGGLFTWITAGPIILIHGAKISPVVFGYLCILIGFSYVLGSTINSRCIKKEGIHFMLKVGWLIMFLAGLLTLLGYFIAGINVYVVLLPAFFFVLGTTFVFANAIAVAFTPFGHIAGYCGSLYSCIQLLGGVLFTALSSYFNTNSQLPMAWMFMASGLLAWVVFRIFVKEDKHEAT